MKDVVLFVHGTGATSDSDIGEQWWQRESAFHKRACEHLKNLAECQPSGIMFRWSGDNSEQARRDAALHLATKLASLERERLPYHLVGHSHGGSVIWLALQRLYRDGRLSCFRSWTSVGTPFLVFEPTMPSPFSLLPAVIAAICVTASWSYLTQFVKYWRDIAADGNYAMLASIPLLVSFVSLFLLYSVGLFIRQIYLNRQRPYADNLSSEVARGCAPNYLGIWCTEDEAISGLASTLDLSFGTTPRYRLPETARWIQLSARIVKPLIFVYNHLFAPAIDEFIWGRVTRRLQGCDRPGFRMDRVQTSPDPNATSAVPLPSVIEANLIFRANARASEAIGKCRSLLGLAATSGPSMPRLLTGLRERLTWKELIHTSYFDDPQVCEMIFKHIGQHSENHKEVPKTDSGSYMNSAGNAHARQRSSERTVSRLNLLVSLTISVVLATAWLTLKGIGNTSLYRYTDAYQAQAIEAEGYQSLAFTVNEGSPDGQEAVEAWMLAHIVHGDFTRAREIALAYSDVNKRAEALLMLTRALSQAGAHNDAEKSLQDLAFLASPVAFSSTPEGRNAIRILPAAVIRQAEKDSYSEMYIVESMARIWSAYAEGLAVTNHAGSSKLALDLARGLFNSVSRTEHKRRQELQNRIERAAFMSSGDQDILRSVASARGASRPEVSFFRLIRTMATHGKLDVLIAALRYPPSDDTKMELAVAIAEQLKQLGRESEAKRYIAMSVELAKEDRMSEATMFDMACRLKGIDEASAEDLFHAGNIRMKTGNRDADVWATMAASAACMKDAETAETAAKKALSLMPDGGYENEQLISGLVMAGFSKEVSDLAKTDFQLMEVYVAALAKSRLLAIAHQVANRILKEDFRSAAFRALAETEIAQDNLRSARVDESQCRPSDKLAVASALLMQEVRGR